MMSGVKRRAIFNWAMKVIRDWVGFLNFALRLVQKTRTTFSQPIRWKSKADHDLVACVFPRFGQFSCDHWFLRVFSFILIGCRGHCNFGFMTLNRKAPLCTFIFLNIPVSLEVSFCILLLLPSKMSAGICAVVQRVARSSIFGVPMSSASSPPR